MFQHPFSATFKVLLLTISFFISAPFSVQAVGVINIGDLNKVTLHPSLGYTFGYNDNIFLEENNRESDLYHRFSMGVGILYSDTPAPVKNMIATQQWINDSIQSSDSYLHVNANIDLWRFTDVTDANFETYSANLRGQYRTPHGFYIKAYDDFLHTDDPFGESNEAGEGENTQRIVNRAGIYAGYALGQRITLQAGYGNNFINYDDFEDKWQNRVDNILSATLYYRILPKTSVLAEYRFTDRYFYDQQDLDDNNRGADDDTAQDSSVHEFLTGLSFDPSAKLNGEFKIGVAHVDYDNDENWDGDDYDDTTTWSMEGSLIWYALEKTRLHGVFLRTVRPSAENYATQYVDTQVLVGLTHELIKDFALLNAEIGAGYADFDVDAGVEEREDKILQLGLGMELLIQRWLSMSLDYGYLRRDSSFDGESYTNNIVEWSLQATF